MNEETLRILASNALVDHIYHDPRFPPSLYYRFLKMISRNIKSRLSVELGVAGGGGSLYLAMGSWGQVVGVDLDYINHVENIEYVKKEFKNFIFWEMDTVASAKPVYDTFGEVDILFLDSVHTFDQTTKEYLAYKPYLSDKAVICLDDLHRTEMVDVWNWFTENVGKGLRLDFLHSGSPNVDGGFGVIYNLRKEA